MNKIFKEGDKYGSLLVVCSDDDVSMVQWGGKGRKILVYELRCDCGKIIKVTGGGWNKNKRDCGCGIAGEEESTCNVSSSMTIRTRKRIRKYAVEMNKSFSKAFVELAEMALDIMSTESKSDEVE